MCNLISTELSIYSSFPCPSLLLLFSLFFFYPVSGFLFQLEINGNEIKLNPPVREELIIIARRGRIFFNFAIFVNLNVSISGWITCTHATCDSLWKSKKRKSRIKFFPPRLRVLFFFFFEKIEFENLLNTDEIRGRYNIVEVFFFLEKKFKKRKWNKIVLLKASFFFFWENRVLQFFDYEQSWIGMNYL